MANNTILDTNLNISPYFDDYVDTSDQYKVLFKPATAVQTRELNQLQSILQNQINRFGRNIYKDGSIIEGCTFTFDSAVSYIKLADTFSNGTTFTTSDFLNQYVVNGNGLEAIIIDTKEGYISQAPNTKTLFVKYLNSALYANGDQQSTFDPNESLTIKTSANVSIGTVLVAANTTNISVGNSTGFSYLMATTAGIIFKKGIFLYVEPQTIVVSPYTNKPDNLSVGFDAFESIETAQANSALYDNAAGSPNYSAPGADRLKIVPQLVVKETSVAASGNSFFSLADFKNGAVVTLRQTAEYSSIGAEMARRTFETNGDFVASPFIITTNQKDISDPLYSNSVNLIVGKGLGYVKGYRVEYLDNTVLNLRKALDYNAISNQIVTTNFGYYVYVNEFAGEFGDSSSIIEVELHNTTQTAVTNGNLLNIQHTSGTRIGTAYVRGFSYDDGVIGTATCQYRLYLFNIVMDPGQKFADVKSIVYYDGATKGVSDVVLSYNAASAANVANLQDTYLNTMIFPFGQRAIKTDGFNNTSFVYRKKLTTAFNSSGNGTISVPPAIGTGSEVLPYSGALSSSEQKEFIVVATSQGYSANLSGTVSVSSGNSIITGSTTSFLSEYNIGDYIDVNGESKLIISIANNTSMTAELNFNSTNASSNHSLSFPPGYAIPFGGRNDRFIVINTSTSATLILGSNLDTTFNADIYTNVDRTNTVPVNKIVNKNVYVKIKCNTNDGGFTGPWSLGLPDVLNIDGVWLNTGTTYDDTLTDHSVSFTLDNGQRDTHYELANLKVKSGSVAFSKLNANSTILVKLSYFNYDQTNGRGFFTANSYPIDDINGSANTNAITTEQIPLFTTSKGTVFDLRDCVDFRPFASNTAANATSIAAATINPSSTLVFNSNPYVPVPDSVFQTDLEYYLQRVDRVSVDTNGKLLINEGIPVVNNPKPPQEIAGTMTLGIVSIPPYPSLPTYQAKISKRYDYAITSTLMQNRRFTMKDIGTLQKRIENLEYYTSLSLLETSATKQLVRSDVTGQNRFQNGIFVDPFKGFDLSNTIDPKFYIAIDSDRSELRPSFKQLRISLDFDNAVSNTENVVQHGSLIMLKHTNNNLYISQGYASKYRNCTEGNIFNWKGVLRLQPNGSLSPNIVQSPDVINNIDLGTNWVNMGQSRNPWGASWGNWQTVSSDISSAQVGTNSSKNQITTTLTQNQQRVGTTLNTKLSSQQYDAGNYVTSIDILPYLNTINIAFVAHGMKPNTKVYAYFGNIPVSSFCSPLSPIFGKTGVQGDMYSGIPGDQLYTDDTGSVYGNFYLPPNSFKSEEIVFMLADISDLAQGASAITTSAQDTFFGSRLTYNTAQLKFNTRQTIQEISEFVDTRTITNSTDPVVITITPPPPPTPPICPREVYPPYVPPPLPPSPIPVVITLPPPPPPPPPFPIPVVITPPIIVPVITPPVLLDNIVVDIPVNFNLDAPLESGDEMDSQFDDGDDDGGDGGDEGGGDGGGDGAGGGGDAE